MTVAGDRDTETQRRRRMRSHIYACRTRNKTGMH